MTVTYSAHCSLKKRGCNFLRLLRLCKGSIYKLLYTELVIFWTIYAILNLFYRFAFDDIEKERFILLCIFFNQYTNFVPLTFLLAFYVNMIVVRWWAIFKTMPWPDNLAMRVSVYIPGLDDRSRLIRRTMMRWLNLAAVLTFRSISTAARKRYPSMEHVRKAGLITAQEQEEMDKLSYPSHKYWVPVKWSLQLMCMSRIEGRLANDRFLIELVTQIDEYRKKLQKLLDYDWISVPLVYTQVVTLAVYSFFFALLFSRQYTPVDSVVLRIQSTYSLNGTINNELLNTNDPYSPVLYTTLQFLFYMGWLKVAEVMINPLGLDDDDFEVNWIMDRNLKSSLLSVDNMTGRLPTLKPDAHWHLKSCDIVIPHTKASKGVKVAPQFNSQQQVQLTKQEMEFVVPIKYSDQDLGSSSVRRDAPIKQQLKLQKNLD